LIKKGKRIRQTQSRKAHVYGPVPSRRLGFSLGIDIIPLKTCSFSCIYCQLGRTPRKSVKRKKYFSSSEILSQVREKISSGQKIDYITFSGSGEPTLNTVIGKLIREVKKMASIPVAVLTNSSLLALKSVRRALMAADVVAPSLDAASADMLARVNRPHPSLKMNRIIEGLVKFRREFKGLIWLEVMLVKGVNDSPPHIRKLKEAIARIKPDKVQLNTVVRPPAEKFARALSRSELEKIKKFFGKNCEIIAGFKKKPQMPPSENLGGVILSLVQRRPVTLQDISASLGESEKAIRDRLHSLLERGKIKSVIHKGLTYYEKS
jgi:wyosine [tRNA(Phe)-imidazoG37] synthetase (radical SAM superfamily)